MRFTDMCAGSEIITCPPVKCLSLTRIHTLSDGYKDPGCNDVAKASMKFGILRVPPKQ